MDRGRLWSCGGALLMLLGSACGPSGSSGTDEPDAMTTYVPPSSCGQIKWATETASNTPGTISHEAPLAVTAGGMQVIAWTEPGATGSLSDEDLFVATWAGSSWEPPQRLTNDTAVQNAYPSMVVDGETIHLAWNNYSEGPNDIYYAKNAGGGFSTRVNVSKMYEGGVMRHAYNPSIAISPQGQLSVAYLSAPASATGGFAGPAEVRFATLSNDAFVGAPKAIIPATGAGCFDPEAIYDSAGTLYVVASCGAIGNEEVYYAVNTGGSWAMAKPVPGSSSTADDTVPIVVRGGDGKMHVVWLQDSMVMYTKGEGGLFLTAQPLKTTLSGNTRSPTVAVDSNGIVTIAYHRMLAGNWSDVFVTASPDGAAFETECNLTNTPDSDEQFPFSLQIDPTTGTRRFTYEKVLKGSDPLDAEIMHVHETGDPGVL